MASFGRGAHGKYHSVVPSAEGDVFTWGCGGCGCLGQQLPIAAAARRMRGRKGGKERDGFTLTEKKIHQKGALKEYWRNMIDIIEGDRRNCLSSKKKYGMPKPEHILPPTQRPPPATVTRDFGLFQARTSVVKRKQRPCTASRALWRGACGRARRRASFPGPTVS